MKEGEKKRGKGTRRDMSRVINQVGASKTAKIKTNKMKNAIKSEKVDQMSCSLPILHDETNGLGVETRDAEAEAEAVS